MVLDEEMEEENNEEQSSFDGVAMEEDEDDGERVGFLWAAHCAPNVTNSRRPLASMVISKNGALCRSPTCKRLKTRHDERRGREMG